MLPKGLPVPDAAPAEVAASSAMPPVVESPVKDASGSTSDPGNKEDDESSD